jgi:quercetin 2,3-dioxygenase
VASPFAGVLHPREVPLGGPRAILVRRTLPQRERSLIGAWCFADDYGTTPIAVTPVVAAHRHTVESTSLDGEMRDSLPSNVS